MLTPIERDRALALGEEVDRLPVVLFDNLLATRLTSMTYRESEADATHLAEKLLASYRRFGHDAVTMIYSAKSFARLLGSRVTEPEDGPARIEEYALGRKDPVDKLDFHRVNRDTDAGQAKITGAVRLFQAETAGQAYCRIHLPAPFSGAGNLMAPEDMLRNMRKRPEDLHYLLEQVTGMLAEVGATFSSLPNTYFSIGDPLASGSLLSPKAYQEFALPYTKTLVEALRALAPKTFIVLHICGNTAPLFPAIKTTGVNAFSLDQAVSIADARAALGDTMHIWGHVDPVKVFLQGDRQSMADAVQEAYLAGGGVSEGFCLAPGCDVPMDTPFAQVDAYLDSATKFYQEAIHHDKVSFGC